MKNLKTLLAEVEAGAGLPSGGDEGFSGYAVMGLPFSSGHVLALRRFPASSVGPGYNSVWVRQPSGNWTMYTDVAADVSCPRYFGNALESTAVRRISIAWPDEHRFMVDIADDVDLHWEVSVAATRVTRLMSALTSALPERLWRSRGFLKATGAVAGPLLQAGRLQLAGQAPNGQRFRATSRRMWFISESTASLGGEDFGTPQALPVQSRLGDFWIPQRGIFIIGSAAFEPFDPAMRPGTRASPK